MRHSVLLLLFCFGVATADNVSVDFGGHTKVRAVGRHYPAGSLLRDIAGSTSVDSAAELRLTLLAKASGWTFASDYQLLGIRSDFLPFGIPNDDQRLLDMTKVFYEGSDSAALHRLDRLWFGYAGERFVVRIGRQALTWGNGLYFHPMDLVNPFDPETIDTEFKTGDDMAYGQYLRSNGDDIQAAFVARRDLESGDVDSDEGTAAVKYHGFAGDYEYDVLVARHFGDNLLGMGAVGSIGGAVWRGDIVITDTDEKTRVELVANISYSWIWSDMNVSGAVEYFRDGDAHDYLAGSLMIEASPLLTITPTLISNLDDPSALLQFVTQYSLGDNLVLLGSLDIPIGANGTEFGGPETGIPGRYLSYDAGLFVQFAWYF